MSGCRFVVSGGESFIKQAPMGALLGTTLQSLGNNEYRINNIIGNHFDDIACNVKIYDLKESLNMPGIRLRLSDALKLIEGSVTRTEEFIRQDLKLDRESPISATRVMEAAELFAIPKGESEEHLQRRLERVDQRVTEMMKEFEQHLEVKDNEKEHERWFAPLSNVAQKEQAEETVSKLLRLETTTREHDNLMARLVRAYCDADLLEKDFNDPDVPPPDLSQARVPQKSGNPEESLDVCGKPVNVWDDDSLNKIVREATSLKSVPPPPL